MEEVHRLHKDTPFGWVKFLRDLMQAQALARPERGFLLWGEGRTTSTLMGRPDQTYNLIRGALRPRM